MILGCFLHYKETNCFLPPKRTLLKFQRFWEAKDPSAIYSANREHIPGFHALVHSCNAVIKSHKICISYKCKVMLAHTPELQGLIYSMTDLHQCPLTWLFFFLGGGQMKLIHCKLGAGKKLARLKNYALICCLR